MIPETIEHHKPECKQHKITKSLLYYIFFYELCTLTRIGCSIYPEFTHYKKVGFKVSFEYLNYDVLHIGNEAFTDSELNIKKYRIKIKGKRRIRLP
jgi:hypothetical protein